MQREWCKGWILLNTSVKMAVELAFSAGSGGFVRGSRAFRKNQDIIPLWVNAVSGIVRWRLPVLVRLTVHCRASDTPCIVLAAHQLEWLS